MNLTNPHASEVSPSSNDTLIQCRTSPRVFNYLFNGVLVGSRGCRQAIINTFLEALYQECIRQNLQPSYDPSNEQRLAAILSGLNFNPATVGTVGSKPLRSKRPNGTGRTNPPASKLPEKSPLNHNDSGRANGGSGSNS